MGPSQDGKREAPGENAAAERARMRHVAMQHALSIEEKKKLQNQVLDLINVAYDLPSDATTDPAHPSDTDANTFRECLAIFRPSDLDELVYERNIDDRCGYALCTRPKQKEKRAKVWDSHEGKMVDRLTEDKWCSNDCKEMHAFVRKQLGLEPAWLRSQATSHVTLRSDATTEQRGELEEEPQKEQLGMQEVLARERGEPNARLLDNISIHEREPAKTPQPPQYVPEITVNDVLEGMPIPATRRGERDRAG